MSKQCVTYLLAFYYTLLVNEILRAAFIKDESTCEQYPCLIFKDDFETLDFTTWEHISTAALTGNKEFQYYTNNRTNSYVKNGSLYLKPTLTNDTYGDEFLTSGKLNLRGSTPYSKCSTDRYDGCFRTGKNHSIVNPIQSAAVRTIRSFSFKYGRIKIKAKLPRGDWIWPALWLMPKYNAYGDWPASGEIDIMESRGNDHYYTNTNKSNRSRGNDCISQSLHWGPYVSVDSHYVTQVNVNEETGSYADKYHVFSVDWTPDYITFFVDDTPTLNVTAKKGGFWELGKFSNISKHLHNPWQSGTDMAPFDQEFYLIMNLAVGGNNNYFDDNYKPKTPWNSKDKVLGKLMKDFWDARGSWLPTWNGEDTALKIDYVEVWKQKDFK